MKNLSREKENKYFILALSAFVILMIYRYWDRFLSNFNATIYAFSYKYGFRSRGLLGSIWQGLDAATSLDLMNNKALWYLSILATAMYMLAFLLFFIVVLKKTSQEYLRNVRYLIIFLTIFAVPMFLNIVNFGRSDIYLFMITLVCLILIVCNTAEWLIIPLVVLAECIHHGYIFMNINIILALLIYKIIKQENRRLKYIIIFALVLLSVSGVFLISEFGSHDNGYLIYDEVVSLAKKLSPDGKTYSKELIQHEILGQGVYMDEWEYHVANFIDTPIFIFFMWPYLAIAGHFIKGVMTGQKNWNKVAYFFVCAGALTVLPEVVMKVDFGRYVFAVFFYYIAIVLCLIAMGDTVVADQLQTTKLWVKSKCPFAIVLLVYPMLFTPLFDITISAVDDQLRVVLFHGKQYFNY